MATPHLGHMIVPGAVGMPQFGQNASPASGGRPHRGHSADWSLTTVVHVRQNIFVLSRLSDAVSIERQLDDFSRRTASTDVDGDGVADSRMRYGQARESDAGLQRRREGPAGHAPNLRATLRIVYRIAFARDSAL